MDLYATLASNMDEITTMFSSKMKQYDADLKKFSDGGSHSHSDIASLSREFSDFKCMIWKTISMLKSQMELFLLGLDRHETTSRRKVLLFHGIADSKEPDVSKVILQILMNQLKMTDITLDDISACHRLGSNTSKPRPILVRFAQYKHRSLVWNAKSMMKNTKITLTEFLTKARHDVFMSARKHFGINKCWSSEGKIVILLSNNKRHKIEVMSELQALMVEHPVSQPSQVKKAKGSAQEKGQSSSATAAKKRVIK